MNEFDLIIIGGGAAGFSASIKANEFAIRTLMVNNKKIGIGGTCVNVGCVPTKYLLHIAKILNLNENKKFKGINISTSYNFNEVIKGKEELISSLRKQKYKDVLDSLENVTYLEGDARFLSNNEIEVNGEKIRGKKFIICTGSSPKIPPIEGIEKVDYLTNIEILSLNYLPSSLIVLGGGPQAVEIAQIFSRFGTKVYMFKRSPRILKKEEPELAQLLTMYLEDDGIEIYTNSKILKLWQKGGIKFLQAQTLGGIKTFQAEEILIATGREPNTKGLGLENIDVKLGSHNEIVVNDEMQAGKNIWAAGDVTGEPMLETVAAREGMIAGNNAISENKIKMDYRVVPHAIFTDPQLASVGLTDYMAIKKGYTCRCNTILMEVVPKAAAIKDTRGAVKMVINHKTEEILGIHILSPEAADIIHEGIMILKNNMKLDDVIETLHIFPTLSEAIKIAAQSFKKDVTKMSCCVE